MQNQIKKFGSDKVRGIYFVTFKGISRVFSLKDQQQFQTIGQFWDELAHIYGLENLRGLGYNWQNNEISYAIGLKNGSISGFNVSIELPDEGWITVKGMTDRLDQIYDEIYEDGPIRFEIEAFYENGECEIMYTR